MKHFKRRDGGELRRVSSMSSFQIFYHLGEYRPKHFPTIIRIQTVSDSASE